MTSITPHQAAVLLCWLIAAGLLALLCIHLADHIARRRQQAQDAAEEEAAYTQEFQALWDDLYDPAPVRAALQHAREITPPPPDGTPTPHGTRRAWVVLPHQIADETRHRLTSIGDGLADDPHVPHIEEITL